MHLVGSVGWLAFFTGDALARHYRPFLLRGLGNVICPTIVLYEVAKKIERQHGTRAAAVAVAHQMRARVIDLDTVTATAAARLSIMHKLAMADAIVYATAQQHRATFVTSDAHFDGLPGVTYIPHPNVHRADS